MKILKVGKPASSNFRADKTQIVVCDCCESELEYKEADLEPNHLSTGEYYVVCPVCKFKVTADPIEQETVSYPEDFYFFNHGLEIDNERKQNMINECLDWLRIYPNENYSFTATGNTFVIAYKSDGDVEIIVATQYGSATFGDFYEEEN